MERHKGLIITLVVLFLFFCGGKPKTDKGVKGFTLKTIDGETVGLSDYKGNVVIVDFWATWCPPCRRSIPHLISLYEKYKERGLIILGISKEDLQILKNFRDESRITYPLLLGTNEVFRDFGVQAIPHTVFFDKKGRIRKTQTGFSDELVPIFEALIDTLINE